MSTLDAVPHRRDGILVQEAKGQTVLLRPEDGSYYAVREVGARIWELCDGERAVSDIVAAVCAEFDAPVGTVEVDVLEFITELQTEQLIVCAP